MIRFQCPTCQESLKAADGAAGRKVPCPNCGQRLLVPPPTRNRTVLGQPLPPESVTPAAGRDPPPAPAQPPATVLVVCPGCGRRIDLPTDKLLAVVECARCDRRFIPGAPQELHAPPEPAPPWREAAAPPAGLARLGNALSVAGVVVTVVGALFLFLPCFWMLSVPVSGLAVGCATVGLVMAVRRREPQLWPLVAFLTSVLLLVVSLTLVIGVQISTRRTLEEVDQIWRQSSP